MPQEKIELRPSDLIIKKVMTNQGEAQVVQIRPSLAFDESFIQEMMLLGVREWKAREE